ncbi:NUDIX domain-containing protein [Streptomyces albidoflavus]|uniref:NUDIX domain-containing protein n=1 Tax=Streptomyces albidoflavus TaxID=1886 RepID=UPI0033A08055
MTEGVDRVDERDRVIGVVERGEAVRNGWPHRIAVTVCHRADGRRLVHRRPAHATRFPGLHNGLIGGAVTAGESYEAAAAREPAEELGVRAHPVPLFTFFCDGAIFPYWLARHETRTDGPLRPVPAEIAGLRWCTAAEIDALIAAGAFVPDGAEAWERARKGGHLPGR